LQKEQKVQTAAKRKNTPEKCQPASQEMHEELKKIWKI
jgi:hypothetical protein